MRKITYKRFSVGRGTAHVTAALDSFVQEIPGLFYFGYAPSLPVLNAFLRTGRASAGMGGGVSWTPLELEPGEYQELLVELRRSVPDLRTVAPRRERSFVFTRVPEDVDTALKWTVWIDSVEMRIPYARHLELAEKEARLAEVHRNLVIARAPDPARRDAAHLCWISAAEALTEFTRPYFEAFVARKRA